MEGVPGRPWRWGPLIRRARIGVEKGDGHGRVEEWTSGSAQRERTGSEIGHEG